MSYLSLIHPRPAKTLSRGYESERTKADASCETGFPNLERAHGGSWSVRNYPGAFHHARGNRYLSSERNSGGTSGAIPVSLFVLSHLCIAKALTRVMMKHKFLP